MSTHTSMELVHVSEHTRARFRDIQAYLNMTDDQLLAHALSSIRISHLSRVPFDALCIAFEYLPATDIVKCCTVCSRWMRIIGGHRKLFAITSLQGILVVGGRHILNQQHDSTGIANRNISDNDVNGNNRKNWHEAVPILHFSCRRWRDTFSNLLPAPLSSAHPSTTAGLSSTTEVPAIFSAANGGHSPPPSPNLVARSNGLSPSIDSNSILARQHPRSPSPMSVPVAASSSIPGTSSSSSPHFRAGGSGAHLPVAAPVPINEQSVMDNFLRRIALPIDVYHCAVCVADRKLYVVGGRSEDVRHDYVLRCDLVAAMMYATDKRRGTEQQQQRQPERQRGGPPSSSVSSSTSSSGGPPAWEFLPPMRRVRSAPCAAVVKNKLFVFGGFDGVKETETCEILDLTTMQWMAAEKCPTLPYPACEQGSCVHNGIVYLVGGTQNRNHDPETYLSVVQCFDTATNSFTMLPKMSTDRLMPADGVQVVVDDRDGGHDSYKPLRNGERYWIGDANDKRAASGDWKKMSATMLTPRSNASGVASDGLIYMVCGHHRNSLRSIEVFVPALNKWVECGNLREERDACRCALLE